MQDGRKLNVLMICGRVHLWQESIDKVQTHLKDRDTNSTWITIISAHGDLADPTDLSDIKGLIQRTAPVKVNVERAVLGTPEPHPMYVIQGNRHIRMNSMFYHNFRAFQLLEEYLKENNLDPATAVNWVFKTRADWPMLSPWDIPSEPESNTVYIPTCASHYGNSWSIPCNMPDQAAGGSFEAMRLYCSVWPNLRPFYEQHGISLVNGEHTLGHHIQKHNLTVVARHCEYGGAHLRQEHDDYGEGRDASAARVPPVTSIMPVAE